MVQRVPAPDEPVDRIARDEIPAQLAGDLFDGVLRLVPLALIVGTPFWGNALVTSVVLGAVWLAAWMGRWLVGRGRHRLAAHGFGAFATAMAVGHAVTAVRPIGGGLLLLTPLVMYAVVCGRGFAITAAAAYVASVALVQIVGRESLGFPVLFPSPALAELVDLILAVFGVFGPMCVMLERLRISAAQAEASSRAKTSFLAVVSHEIRTPMNAILGLCDLMELDRPSPTQRQRLSRINQAARHLLACIDDILDLASLNLGRPAIRPGMFSPAVVVQEVGDMLRGMAESGGLTLATDIDATLPPWVEGDSLRIRQILLNLGGNAVKFTHQGRVTIRVGLRPSRAQGSAGSTQARLRFEVVDTGVGMTPDQCSRVFEAFQQADLTIRRRYGGSGLGLSVCQRLVDAMGGDIGVDSQTGSGSTFWFELSLPVAAPQWLPTAPPETDAELRGPRRLEILVVEDDPVNQEVTHDLLTSLGHCVSVASSGDQALELAAAAHYDLVLMDMHMPIMDGLTAAPRLRGLSGYASTPIVALTADANPDAPRRCLAAGMTGVLTKPVTREQLSRLLGSLIATSPAAGSTAVLPVSAESSAVFAALQGVTGLNAAAGLDQAAGRVETYLDVLATLVRVYAGASTSLQQLLAKGEFVEAHRLSHSVKGAAAAVGASALVSSAAAAEAATRRRVQGQEEQAGTAEAVQAMCEGLDRLVAGLVAVLPPSRLGGPGEAPSGLDAEPVETMPGPDLRPIVLAVEDSEPQLAQLVAALAGEYRLRTAATGDAALAMMQSDEPPHLVLLDVLLPGMSGLDVCRAIKSSPDPDRRDIPVIFVSALNDSTDEREGLDAGGIDYVTKPIQPALVASRVRNHLELSRQRRELRASYDRLTQLERMRDDLVHMMVHDFRAPLMVQRMAIDSMLEGGELTEAVAEDLTFVREGTTRLTGMVTAMLDISRMESGVMPLTLAPCDLAAVARATVAEFKALLRRRSVDVASDPCLAFADSGLIQRVLQNLIGNALQFTSDTGRISVTFAQEPSGVRCRVIDDGRGVPLEFRGRIFEKFGQANRQPRRQSTGLGLTFCKLVVELHGGQIGVDSGPDGVGSEFWFSLPVPEPSVEHLWEAS